LNFNPFDAQASQVYKEKTQITDQNLTILLNSILGSFENESEYNQHDPISLAKHLPHEALKNKVIYLNVGTQDEYGLFSGAQTLSTLLTEKDLPHLLKIIENGKHDAPYVKNQINSLFESLLLACKFASIT
jgi:hypothetical protein